MGRTLEVSPRYEKVSKLNATSPPKFSQREPGGVPSSNYTAATSHSTHTYTESIKHPQRDALPARRPEGTTGHRNQLRISHSDTTPTIKKDLTWLKCWEDTQRSPLHPIQHKTNNSRASCYSRPRPQCLMKTHTPPKSVSAATPQAPPTTIQPRPPSRASPLGISPTLQSFPQWSYTRTRDRFTKDTPWRPPRRPSSHTPSQRATFIEGDWARFLDDERKSATVSSRQTVMLPMAMGLGSAGFFVYGAMKDRLGKDHIVSATMVVNTWTYSTSMISMVLTSIKQLFFHPRKPNVTLMKRTTWP